MVRRLILAVFTIVAISMLSFLIIHLPPGDFVDVRIANQAAALRLRAGVSQIGV